MAISAKEKIKLRKFCSKLVVIVRTDFTFVEFLKSVLNFSIAFEKEYSERYVAARICGLCERYDRL